MRRALHCWGRGGPEGPSQPARCCLMGWGRPLDRHKMKLREFRMDLSGCAAQMAREYLPKATVSLSGFCSHWRLAKQSCSSQGIAMQPAERQSIPR